MEMLSCKIVKARKEHLCNMCATKIAKGERYEHQTNKCDGRIYEWRTHLHCKKICSEIWDYVDPDEGMTGDDFRDAVKELMHQFYCPCACTEYIKAFGDCERGFDREVCVKRFAQFMETHELQKASGEDGQRWRMVENEKGRKESEDK